MPRPRLKRYGAPALRAGTVLAAPGPSVAHRCRGARCCTAQCAHAVPAPAHACRPSLLTPVLRPLSAYAVQRRSQQGLVAVGQGPCACMLVTSAHGCRPCAADLPTEPRHLAAQASRQPAWAAWRRRRRPSRRPGTSQRQWGSCRWHFILAVFASFGPHDSHFAADLPIHADCHALRLLPCLADQFTRADLPSSTTFIYIAQTTEARVIVIS